ncbi:hypothetical protein [Bacteroides acidifaciens]|uniref:hypothetical protein n=1 Tax=Bacteroides acidifaciens TaxID=85831 RepID=UPI0025580AF4|nr:hypothetical protein [Bacteroides acidifaciens]
MAVTPRHTNKEILGFFRSKLSDLGEETALKYRRTITEFDIFLSSHNLYAAEFSDIMVADWATELFRQGLAKTTVIRHLNILNSLVKAADKNGLMSSGDAARILARELTESQGQLPALMNERTFNNCLGLLRRIAKKSDYHNIYEDLLLFSMLNGAMSFDAIIGLKKEDVLTFDKVSRVILERNVSPVRRYVFDLKQSYRTEKQIHAAIADGLATVFERGMGIKYIHPDNFVRSMWATCAVRRGAMASESLGCVGGDASYGIPSFCKAVGVMAEKKQLWVESVNQIILHKMPKWYAMHLRRGVKFEDIRKYLSERFRPVPEFFYPYETITRRIGNKKVAEDHPIISQTAFFKTHPEDVLPMFSLIGDKAWCYRVNNDPSSPYAVISPQEMRRFQAAIGIFSPNMEVHPLGELTPMPGESVIVVTAGYGNREGKVEDVINKDSGTAIFRVKLFTDQGYEWRMDVDARQIELIQGNLSVV